MPKYSTIGYTYLVAHPPPGTTRHVFSPDESAASLTEKPAANPTGITFVLPGPTSTPDDLPNDGDSYAIMDPALFSDSTHGIFVDFGGSKFNGSTAVFGPVTFGPIKILFTYDSKLGAWSIAE